MSCSKSKFQVEQAEAKSEYNELMFSFKSEGGNSDPPATARLSPPIPVSSSLLPVKSSLNSNLTPAQAVPLGNKTASLIPAVFQHEAAMRAIVLQDLTASCKQLSPVSARLRVCSPGPLRSSLFLDKPFKPASEVANRFWTGEKDEGRSKKPQRETARATGTRMKEMNVRSPRKQTPVAVIARSRVWERSRREKLAAHVTRKQQQDLVECTFSPTRVTRLSRLASPYEQAVLAKTAALLHEYYESKR